jgi:cysteine synthase A
MAKIHNNILSTIGNTPLVKMRKIAPPDSNVLAKMESFNPCGSVKDRIALSMIKDAEEQGKIKPGTAIIEPTSGNTGIGLALVCAAKGYKLKLTMPESMSSERRSLLKMLGAEVVLTPAEEGMKGAVEQAKNIAEQEKAFMPGQFTNPANPKVHRETTAEEIWQDTDGKVDFFVAGVGTGGTITGCGEVFKSRNKNVKIIAVEPEDSPVLSGGQPGPHKIQGIGAGFVPDVLNNDIIDEIIKVSNDDAIETSKNMAKKEGILGGISAGANLWAALKIAARKENKSKNIVFVMCDTGERYISTELFK